MWPRMSRKSEIVLLVLNIKLTSTTRFFSHECFLTIDLVLVSNPMVWSMRNRMELFSVTVQRDCSRARMASWSEIELLLQSLGKGQIIWDHFQDPQTDLRVKNWVDWL